MNTSGDALVIQRMAKELMRMNPMLHGREWRQLKSITQKSLLRDAERLLRIARGEKVHA